MDKGTGNFFDRCPECGWARPGHRGNCVLGRAIRESAGRPSQLKETAEERAARLAETEAKRLRVEAGRRSVEGNSATVKGLKMTCLEAGHRRVVLQVDNESVNLIGRFNVGDRETVGGQAFQVGTVSPRRVTLIPLFGDRPLTRSQRRRAERERRKRLREKGQ